MIKIKGIEISKDKLQLTKMGDLLAYEGPILSHFISSIGDDYFFFWVDNDKDLNRWIVSPVSNDELFNFFEKKISHRELISQNQKGFVYLIEINNQLDFENIYLINSEKLPKSYLPSKDSFFTDNDYEPYAYRLNSYIQQIHLRNKIVSSNSNSPIIYPTSPSSKISLAKEPKFSTKTSSKKSKKK